MNASTGCHTCPDAAARSGAVWSCSVSPSVISPTCSGRSTQHSGTRAWAIGWIRISSITCSSTGTRALRASMTRPLRRCISRLAHTLGYSHALILYVPFYVAMRLFVHPFPAYSLALAAVMETGIVCLYLLLRRRFHLPFLESLLLTVFFFTSPNVVNGGVSVWSQRASVFLIPPILLPRRHVVWHDGSLLENWRRRADRTAGGIALHPRLLHGAVRRVLRGAGRPRLCPRVSLHEPGYLLALAPPDGT